MQRRTGFYSWNGHNRGGRGGARLSKSNNTFATRASPGRGGRACAQGRPSAWCAGRRARRARRWRGPQPPPPLCLRFVRGQPGLAERCQGSEREFSGTSGPGRSKTGREGMGACGRACRGALWRVGKRFHRAHISLNTHTHIHSTHT